MTAEKFIGDVRFTGEQISKKFATAAGREAFDRLNALGNPEWIYSDYGNRVYLSPSLTIKKGPFLHSLAIGHGKNVDQVAIATEALLKQAASEPGASVVSNWTTDKRSEYTFDKMKNQFCPR